jgi:hypothetical protein
VRTPRWFGREPAYTALVRFADGTEARMRARERPHVILDAAGELTFFLDHSYTLVQAFVPK